MFCLFLNHIGLMFVDGEFWTEQRRFTLRHLRDLGAITSATRDTQLRGFTIPKVI